MINPDQPAPAPVRPYGRDLARAEKDYEDFCVYGTRSGLYACQQRAEGHLIGDVLTSETLDGLADRMDAIRRRLAGA
jgi:hypothetical protein